MLTTQFQQRFFVALTSRRVCKQVGRKPQHLSPLLQGFVGKALRRRPINAQLKCAEHGLRFSRRTDTKKAEMIDRQYHQNSRSVLWQQTVGSIRVFAH